jgi:hypothetical protein
MTEPWRLRALYAITDTLKTITPSNDYVHDMADFIAEDEASMSRVFRGKAWYGADTVLPMISVLEMPNGADELVGWQGGGEYNWPLLVQGFVNDDHEHPTDPAYRLMAETRLVLIRAATQRLVGRANTPNPFGMGEGKNRIVKADVSHGIVRPADDISAKAYFWVILGLRTVESAEDPYA